MSKVKISNKLSLRESDDRLFQKAAANYAALPHNLSDPHCYSRTLMLLRNGLEEYEDIKTLTEGMLGTLETAHKQNVAARARTFSVHA